MTFLKSEFNFQFICIQYGIQRYTIYEQVSDRVYCQKSVYCKKKKQTCYVLKTNTFRSLRSKSKIATDNFKMHFTIAGNN